LLGMFTFGVAVLNGLLPPATQGRWWAVLHVALTFQFTVLSRIFFRADSLEEAGQITSQLLHWDSLGVREGLFRMQGLYDWLFDRADSLGDWADPLLWAAHYGLLGVIVLGLGYHFVPSRWSERVGQSLIRWMPAPALAVALAGGMFLISRMLEGPRANIYFSF
ncbi:MAG: hypothetical protein RL033_1621, partial [Pseudomonadota bacterium]